MAALHMALIKKASLWDDLSVCGAVRVEGGWVATQKPVNCSLLCMCIVMGVAHHALKSHSVEVLGPVVPEDVGCAVGAGSTPVLDLRHLKHRRMVRETYFKDLLNVFHFSHITKALYGLINSASKHYLRAHEFRDHGHPNKPCVKLNKIAL